MVRPSAVSLCFVAVSLSELLSLSNEIHDVSDSIIVGFYFLSRFVKVIIFGFNWIGLFKESFAMSLFLLVDFFLFCCDA